MLVCAGLAVISGIVSANLWRELRAERQLTQELRQQLLDIALARSAALPPAPVAPAAAGAAMPPTQATGEQAALAATGTDNARPATPAAAVPRFVLDQREMMKDPEYRKARLAQTRMTIPQNFPGLVEELGLSPEEADRLFDLLAENQLEMTDVSMLAATINGVPPDPAVRDDANRRRMELQRRQDESLTAMLGPGRYSQWQEYQQTRGPRQQVMQLARTFEGMGASLTAEQSRSLTTAYIAEQKRQSEEMQRMITDLRQPDPANQARMMEERFKIQAESNRRIVDAARGHLNAQQLDALQASLDQELAMNRASSRLIRQQLPAQGQAATQVFSITAAPAVPVP
jgi:hypothetical protein